MYDGVQTIDVYTPVTCCKYSSSFQQWKNFENRLRFEKVIAKCLVASFFGDTVYIFLLDTVLATDVNKYMFSDHR